MKTRPVITSFLFLLIPLTLIASATASAGRDLGLDEKYSYGPGHLYILAVGVNTYKPPLPTLVGAKPDAVEFADALERAAKGTFLSVKKRVLVDGQATRASLEAAFEKIAAEATPRDTFVFHFSGMGWEDKDSIPSLSSVLSLSTDLSFSTVMSLSGPSFALAVSDTVVTDMTTHQATNEIGENLLSAWNAKIRARRHIIILDSCHSGNSFEAFFPRLMGGPKELVALSGKSVLVLGMEGSVPDTFNYEGKRIQHSPLTYSLIQSLEAKGKLTSKGLEGFVSWKFPQLVSSTDERFSNPSVKSYFVGEDFALRDPQKKLLPVRDLKKTLPADNPFSAVAVSKPTDEKGAERDEKRGIKVGAIDPDKPNFSKARDGKDYALLIATDTYDDAGFKKLSNPIADANAIGEDLKEIYGFEVTLVANPTRAEIGDAIREFQKKKYTPDDQLFIFFAGHGTFDEDGRIGYIVAKDSRAGDFNTYYNYPLLTAIVDNIRCDHIFLMLDVCFGGTFLKEIANNSSRRDRDSTDYRKLSTPEFIRKKLRYRSRKLLTSGEDNPVSDGVAGRHSPFARGFLEALRSRVEKKDVLTFGDVNSFVERGQSPVVDANFGSYEPGSDFLFIPKPN